MPPKKSTVVKVTTAPVVAVPVPVVFGTSIKETMPLVAAQLTQELEGLTPDNRLHVILSSRHKSAVHRISIANEVGPILTQLQENILSDIICCTVNHLPSTAPNVDVQHIFNDHYGNQIEYPYLGFVRTLPHFRYDREVEQRLSEKHQAELHAKKERSKARDEQKKTLMSEYTTQHPQATEAEVKEYVTKALKEPTTKPAESDDEDDDKSVSQVTFIEKFHKQLVTTSRARDLGDTKVTRRYYEFLSETINASVERIARFATQCCVIVHKPTFNIDHLSIYIHDVMQNENFTQAHRDSYHAQLRQIMTVLSDQKRQTDLARIEKMTPEQLVDHNNKLEAARVKSETAAKKKETKKQEAAAKKAAKAQELAAKTAATPKV